MRELIVGIDLGGTRLRAALLDRDLNIIERRETLTQADRGLDVTVQHMLDFVAGTLALAPNDTISGIGISCPGPVNPTAGLLVAPPNLHGWHNVPLVQMFQRKFGFTTYIGNDANVAALAEASRGAAQGYRHVIFMTVSTGIGGGIVSDGRLLLGKDGLAAEIGHMAMAITGEGSLGERVTTLEKEAAGPALARKVRARIEAGTSSSVADLVEGDLTKITGSIVGLAARQGDPLALEVVRRAAFVIGLGLASLVHVFNPEIIVVGGGVSLLGDLLFDPMREAMEAHVIDRSYIDTLKLKPAVLGENVSVIGAAALVVTRGGVEDVASVARKLDAE